MNELAQNIGTSQSNISDWENDKKLPSAAYLIKLSECFEVSIDWLLKGDDKNNLKKKPFSISFSQMAFIINECYKKKYVVTLEANDSNQLFNFEVFTQIYGAIENSLHVYLMLSEEQMKMNQALDHPLNISRFNTFTLRRTKTGLFIVIPDSEMNFVLITTNPDGIGTPKPYAIHLHCPNDWFVNVYNYAVDNINDAQIQNELEKSLDS